MNKENLTEILKSCPKKHKFPLYEHRISKIYKKYGKISDFQVNMITTYRIYIQCNN